MLGLRFFYFLLVIIVQDQINFPSQGYDKRFKIKTFPKSSFLRFMKILSFFFRRDFRKDFI